MVSQRKQLKCRREKYLLTPDGGINISYYKEEEKVNLRQIRSVFHDEGRFV